MKNNALIKVVVAILVFFFIAFFGYHAVRHIFSSYSTVTPVRQTVSRSILTEGLMIRAEKPMDTPAPGSLRYTAREGQKVKSGSVIGYAYSGPEEAAAAALAEEHGRELEMLHTLRKQQETLFSNAQQISDEVDVSLIALQDSLLNGRYETLKRDMLQLEKSLNARAILMREDESVSGRISQLEQLAAADPGRAIKSETTGYFSHFTDGLERELTPELIGTITPERLEEYIGREIDFQEEALGKIILDDVWYFVTEVPAAKAADFAEGQEVFLSFSGSANRAVPCRILLMEAAENGASVMMTIRGDVIDSDIVSRRTASVKISSHAYTGLRFDRELLHVVDREKGVFVKAGSAVRFKKADIIYTGSDYYLSRLNYSSEDSLNLFDKIIVSDKELYDGMPIEDI